MVWTFEGERYLVKLPAAWQVDWLLDQLILRDPKYQSFGILVEEKAVNGDISIIAYRRFFNVHVTKELNTVLSSFQDGEEMQFSKKSFFVHPLLVPLNSNGEASDELVGQYWDGEVVQMGYRVSYPHMSPSLTMHFHLRETQESKDTVPVEWFAFGGNLISVDSLCMGSGEQALKLLTN